MKRWGLRASSLSADTNAEAGQKLSDNQLTPNVLYTMLWHVYFSNHVILNCLFYTKWNFQRYTNISSLIIIIQRL